MSEEETSKRNIVYPFSLGDTAKAELIIHVHVAWTALAQCQGQMLHPHDVALPPTPPAQS